jgi:hypothetical protein
MERERGEEEGVPSVRLAPHRRRVQVSKRRERTVGRSELGLRKGWVGWGAASGRRKNQLL